MGEATIKLSVASVRQAQAILSQLKNDLSAEQPTQEVLTKYIEAIDSAEVMSRGLVDFLQTGESPQDSQLQKS